MDVHGGYSWERHWVRKAHDVYGIESILATAHCACESM
jgi:hypothetical protein